MTRSISPASRRAWTGRRIARLAFLVGQGLASDLVARDPGVATTPGNVRRQANRFGLLLREAADRRLPADVGARLDLAASRRGLSRDRLIRTLAVAAGSDAALIDNILDDDA